jgi:hypothetical protein
VRKKKAKWRQKRVCEVFSGKKEKLKAERPYHRSNKQIEMNH